jgi:hypothetical protein
MNRNCLTCGTAIGKPKYYMSARALEGRKFCSPACAYRGRIQHTAKPKPSKTCCICGTEFFKSSKQSRWGERKTCSRTCAAKSRVTIEVRDCLTCDTNFKPENRRTKYCSRACAAKAHKGKPSILGKPARYKKTNGVLEHRAVMMEMIGRPLVRGETVHHKNGLKRDNRPANLELWFTPQPGGQRIHDLIAYVVEHHAAEVAAAQARLSCLFGAPASSEEPA